MAATIQGYYKGLHLPSYIEYDPHNMKKANSVLAIAFQQQHQPHTAWQSMIQHQNEVRSLNV
jgi:hypothetical protein